MSIERRRTFARTETYVLWDMVDFPLDGEDKIYSFYRNLRSSLVDEGFYGEVRIRAYDHIKPYSKERESIHHHITLFRQSSNRFERHTKILVDMLDFTGWNPQANILLIMKGMPEEEDVDFVNVIEKVDKTNYNLLLVVGDEDEVKSAYPSDVLSCFTDVWTWTSIGDGGSPIPPPRPSTSDEYEDDDDGSDTSNEGSSLKRQKMIDDGSPSSLCAF